MKFLFLPSKALFTLSLESIRSKLKGLPNSIKTIGLVSTIQHTQALPTIRKQLELQGKKAIINGNGQILGCNTINATAIQDKVQAYLYIGSGKFHPLAIALSLRQQKPIFLYNPLTSEFSRLSEKEIQAALARKKAAKIKFLGAKTVGILVSTKPGQNRLKQAEALKTRLKKQGKKCYIFIANDIDLNQLENFPQIEAWVNTSCPGLSLEHPFIWIEEIKP
ncbi:MAG: 2-(3-amino-3-carboxypropyl)histidine synthase subunit [Candidatus Pacearchaeota archaeon]|nr:2-(3-amino-3-carboxypropyl)histidine synthase subunit [Candidatus Pacearchaeota archaeon]